MSNGPFYLIGQQFGAELAAIDTVAWAEQYAGQEADEFARRAARQNGLAGAFWRVFEGDRERGAAMGADRTTLVLEALVVAGSLAQLNHLANAEQRTWAIYNALKGSRLDQTVLFPLQFWRYSLIAQTKTYSVISLQMFTSTKLADWTA